MATVTRLDNGITVICDARPGSGKVEMLVSISGGSAIEADDAHGLTSLMQSVSQSGTTTRSRLQISEEIESKGGSMKAKTVQHRSVYAATAGTAYAADTFDVMADVILHPAFKDDEIRKTKKQLTQYLKKIQEKNDKKLLAGLYEAAYADQALGRNPAGSVDMVSSFSVAQIRECHADMLSRTQDMTIAFSGDITETQALALAEKNFASLPAGQKLVATPAAFTGGDFRANTKDGQVNLFFGFPAASRNDDDYYATAVLEEALSGGMSAYLLQEIREKRGLAYDAQAVHFAMPQDGMFCIMSSTSPENAAVLVQTALNILEGVARNGISAEDLTTARRRLVRSRKEYAEKASLTALSLSEEILDYGRIISDAEFAQRIDVVTADDLRRVCGAMLKSGTAVLSTAGPETSLPDGAVFRQEIATRAAGIVLPEKTASSLSRAPVFDAAATRPQKFDPPQMTVLPNGIKIVTFERPGTLNCGVWMGVGVDNEPENLNGVSHMLEHMMFKGTPSFPAGKLDVLVEKEWGGQTNAYTSLDRTCYYLENLEAASLDTALHACGELAFMANIDHEPFDGAIVVKEDGTTEKIKGERDVVLQEIRDSAEELSSRQGEKMLSMAYPNQPHGKTVLGPAEVVSRLTFEDMRAYRDTYYVPNNAVFCAVGPVKHADVVASITNKFGALTARNFPDTPLPVYVGNTQVIKSDRVETTTVFLAAEGKPLGHKVEAALNALGMLMTSGDSSRLYNDLVNEKEACLTLFSGCESYRSAGFFVTAFVAEAENIQTIIGETFKEIRSLSENVSDEKLDEIKIMMEFDLIAQQEKNSSACDFYACAVQDYGRLMTMQDMVAEIRAITVDDIKAAAKSVLASNPTACIMTPENTPPQYLPTHQTIVELRDGRTPKLPTQTPTLDII